MAESYTPGYSDRAMDFMARRTEGNHAGFVKELLTPGAMVIDLGSGPGSISIGMANIVAPGSVLGLDQAASLVDKATEMAADVGAANCSFAVASAYELPVADSSVDLVFSHALFEHLADPLKL